MNTYERTASVSLVDILDHESVALFTLEDGNDLIKLAVAFVSELKTTNDVGKIGSPEAMMLFCAWLYNIGKSKNKYLGADKTDGVNMMGHYVVSIPLAEIVNHYPND